MTVFKSIKGKIVLSLLIVSLFACISVGIVTYTITSRIVIDEMKNQSYDMTKSVYDLYIKTILTQKMAQLSFLAERLKSDLGANNDITQAWINYIMFNKEVSSVYFGDQKKGMKIYPYVDLGSNYDPRIRDWYKNAIVKPEIPVWTDPYIDYATNQLVVSATQGIMRNNQPDGVIGLDILLTDIAAIIEKLNIGTDSLVILTDASGLIIGHKNRELLGKNLNDIKSEYKRIYSENNKVFETKIDGRKSFIASAQVEETNWKVVSLIPMRSFEAKLRPILLTTVGISLLTILISFIIGLIISQIISKNITSVSLELSNGAIQIGVASGQLSKASQEIANGSTEQAASIEETTSSMEELASMVKQNVENSLQASILATKTSDISKSGFEQMEKMLESMTDIGKSSDDIKNVLDVIDDIAFQTNMLALNAAVEAARAGEAGMGFAVVADEVKSLANKSAESAKETAKMIKESITKITNGVDIARRLSEIFKEILSNVNKVATMSKEVELASKQQDMGIGQVNQAILQFDQVVQSNAASSEETASAAEELQSQVETLNDAIKELVKMITGKNALNKDIKNMNESDIKNKKLRQISKVSGGVKNTQKDPKKRISFESDEELDDISKI